MQSAPTHRHRVRRVRQLVATGAVVTLLGAWVTVFGLGRSSAANRGATAPTSTTAAQSSDQWSSDQWDPNGTGATQALPDVQTSQS